MSGINWLVLFFFLMLIMYCFMSFLNFIYLSFFSGGKGYLINGKDLAWKW